MLRWWACTPCSRTRPPDRPVVPGVELRLDAGIVTQHAKDMVVLVVTFAGDGDDFAAATRRHEVLPADSPGTEVPDQLTRAHMVALLRHRPVVHADGSCLAHSRLHGVAGHRRKRPQQSIEDVPEQTGPQADR